MPLPEQFMQDLKMRSDITDIVSSYVNLRRAGRNLVGLCPFHGEKTPSFNVYPENGSFYCFGCGVGGDVITFVRKIENLDYMEAIRFLAERAGMQVPEGHVDDGLGRLKGRLLEINRETARFYHSVLMSAEGAPGLEYLQKRALSIKTIRHFGLGYSPGSRFALVNHLKQKGYGDEELIQANVAFRGRRGGAVDRFAGRVMFPIIDLRGNVIAFGGRILTDEKPKYLNTSDTLVFHKSNSLFALNFAKNENSEQLILAEGYMDVIALHQAGFRTAVATLGTALTSEQARIMAKYAREVVVCYDADEAGQKATARAIPLLRDAGLNVKVLTVPNGKDPDEFIRSWGDQGYARFRQLLDSTGNDVEYRLQKVRQTCNLETAEGRVRYLTGATEILSTLESRIEQEVYAGRLAEETGVDKYAVQQQIAKNAAKRKRQREQKSFQAFQQQRTGTRDTINPEKASHLRAATAEESLIGALCRFPEFGELAANKLPPEKMVTAFNRRVYQSLLGHINSGKAFSLTDIAGEFREGEISAVAGMIARMQDVVVRQADIEEYIRILIEENERLCAEKADSGHAQDIQSYLQTLKSMKK